MVPFLLWQINTYLLTYLLVPVIIKYVVLCVLVLRCKCKSVDGKLDSHSSIAQDWIF